MKIWHFSLLFALSVSNAAHAAVMNLAPSGTANASSADFGSVAADANDGNRDGDFGNGSVLHTDTSGAAGQFVEIDLGGDRYIDRVLVFPRSEQQQNSVRDFTIDIFNSGGGNVYTGDFLTTGNTQDDPWGSSLMSGTLGQRVRLTVNSTALPNFFALAELEVWGDTSPVPVNLTSTATVTSSPPGFGSTIADGIDGDLASNWDSGTGGRPLFHDAPAAGQGFYKLAFATNINFDEVQLYNRIVDNAATTTTEYRVSILDAADSIVTSQLVTAADRDYDHILNFSGFSGNAVLVEETNPGQFLAFSEVRVFGTPIPEPSSALLGLLGSLFLFRRKRK